MAIGLERREVVTDTTKTTGKDFKPSTIPLSGVGAPTGINASGAISKAKDAESIFKAASKIAALATEDHMQKSKMDGLNAFALGKTEADLVEEGVNRYTLEGFRIQKANTEAEKWKQMETDAIQNENKTVTPEEYHEILGEKYSSLLKEVGDNPTSKKIITSLSESMMPKLMASQVKAHNSWKEEQTALTFSENLVAVSSADDADSAKINTWLKNDIVGQLPNDVRNKMLADAVEQTLDEDNPALYDTVMENGGRKEYGFSEAEWEGIESSKNKLTTRVKDDFKQSATDSIASVKLGLEETGNLARSIEQLHKAKSMYGEAIGTAKFDNAEVALRKRAEVLKKRVDEDAIITNALAVGNIKTLKPDHQQKAYKILDAKIEAEARTSLEAGDITEEEAMDLVNSTTMNTIADLGVVHKDVARIMTGNLGSVLDKDGIVKEEAEIAFNSFIQLKEKAGIGMALKHVTDKGVKQKMELADVIYTTTNDATGALERATMIYAENDKLSLKQRMEKYESKLSTSRIDERLEDLEDRITPGFINTFFGSNAGDSSDFLSDEIAKAVNNPNLRAMIKNDAVKRMIAMPTMEADEAIDIATQSVIGRGDYVLGTYVTVPEGRSIQEDMGINTGEYNVVNNAMMAYLKEHGKQSFTAGAQVGDEDLEEFGNVPWSVWLGNLTESGRDVPPMDIRYVASKKAFELYAYRRTGLGERMVDHFSDLGARELEPINRTPVLIPAKELGEFWKDHEKQKLEE